MGLFKPINSRMMAAFFADVCRKWDELTDEQKASGEFINPDEPVVLHVPNPEWDGDPYDDYEPDNERELFFHVMSVGGGADVDEDGNECGHDGAAIGGMEINQNKYLFNGRRLGKAPK